MNKQIIVGAGGHGRVIADNALKNGYTDICFVDDNAVGDCMGFPVVGKCADIEALDDGMTDFVIGIGNNAFRMAVAEKYGLCFVPLQEGFDNLCKQAPEEYWLRDGVHPTAKGHEFIKREWLRAFATL